MSEERKFKKNYKKFNQLCKKGHVTGFIGYGMMPCCKPKYTLLIMDALDKCTQYEPFLEYLRKSMGVDNLDERRTM